MFAVIEKTRFIIFKDTEAEDPIIHSGRKILFG
jgi:hypothetical protein